MNISRRCLVEGGVVSALSSFQPAPKQFVCYSSPAFLWSIAPVGVVPTNVGNYKPTTDTCNQPSGCYPRIVGNVKRVGSARKVASFAVVLGQRAAADIIGEYIAVQNGQLVGVLKRLRNLARQAIDVKFESRIWGVLKTVSKATAKLTRESVVRQIQRIPHLLLLQ